MTWLQGDINGIIANRPSRFTDSRGWLSEIFRSDGIPSSIMPAMGYLAITHPGISRGPHEHLAQTDIFAFMGPGTFRVKLWDNRKDSPTYGRLMLLEGGEQNPLVLTVPPGVIHGYTNISNVDALVVNLPNCLYAGQGRKSPVDEVRYEDGRDPDITMD